MEGGGEIPLTPQGQDHAPVPVDPLDLHGTIPVRDRPAVAPKTTSTYGNYVHRFQT
jgi:hypothetical protein